MHTGCELINHNLCYNIHANRDNSQLMKAKCNKRKQKITLNESNLSGITCAASDNDIMAS